MHCVYPAIPLLVFLSCLAQSNSAVKPSSLPDLYPAHTWPRSPPLVLTRYRSDLWSLLPLDLWFRYHGRPRSSSTVVFRDGEDVMDYADLRDARRTQDRDRIVSQDKDF